MSKRVFEKSRIYTLENAAKDFIVGDGAEVENFLIAPDAGHEIISAANCDVAAERNSNLRGNAVPETAGNTDADVVGKAISALAFGFLFFNFLNLLLFDLLFLLHLFGLCRSFFSNGSGVR